MTRRRTSRVPVWIALVIFFLTLPLKSQAVVLCIEPDGGIAFEFAFGGCSGCEHESPETLASADDCGCSDVSYFLESNVATKIFLVSDPSKGHAIVRNVPARTEAEFLPPARHARGSGPAPLGGTSILARRSAPNAPPA